MEEWEYWSCFLWAEAEDKEAKEFIKQRFPNWNPPKYAPQAMIPELNGIGKKGWELVHMQPVNAGSNHDVGRGGDFRQWSNTYFCVFKRRVQK